MVATLRRLTPVSPLSLHLYFSAYFDNITIYQTGVSWIDDLQTLATVLSIWFDISV